MKTKSELSLIFTTMCFPVKKRLECTSQEFKEWCENETDMVRTASGLFPEYSKEITRFASAYIGFISAKYGIEPPVVDDSHKSFKEFNRFSLLGGFIYQHFDSEDFVYRLYLMIKEFTAEYPNLAEAYMVTVHVLIECMLNEVN